jgi:large subunit ribosomal protein L25
MNALTLVAKPRTITGKQVDKLRRQRTIPAVIYGHNQASRSVTLDTGAFEATYKKAGATSLVDVTVGSESPVKALIHAIQRHPTTSRVIHVDLYQVKMTEKLEADIELNFIGESPAVKEQGGIFLRTLDKVKVSCLPADLVPSIEVDISVLKTFDDRIHVSDLSLPKGLTLLEKNEEVIASVSAPRSEAELASLSEKVEENVETVEVAKKEKAADEDAEEGAVEGKGDDKNAEKKSGGAGSASGGKTDDKK